MTPKVSILVPIYNVEKYIERCAVSLFEQTYENLEYVFVNDCTPDHSIDVLKQVISRYPNRSSQVKIINQDKNRGVAAARNLALESCSGVFIFYVDSDDFINPNSIETLVIKQLGTDSDIVTGMALMHTNNNEILMPHPHYNSKEEMVLDLMQLTGYHSLWKRLIRKSLYLQHGISAKEGVNCGEDCWLMTQLAYYASSFSFVDEVVYHYDCTRDDSYTAANKDIINKNGISDVIATANLLIDFFKDKEQVYYDEASRGAIKYIENNLERAAWAGDSALFDELLARLRGFDRKYWAAIGWNKSFKRLISQNIHTSRVMQLFVLVYYKIKSFNYKGSNVIA